MSTATPPRDGISFDGGDGRDLEAAFESLYRGHRERVLRLCRAMVGHPQDAEEAAQATMLSAYRALERGDRPGVVGAWLTTIARNECRDLIGRRRVEVPLPDALPAVTSDPAELVERRERMRELRHDLAELPRGQRTAIVLRSMAGMRHSEIAEVVGGSEQAARTLVYEARESLAEFAEGRALGCAEVRPRIDSGDGRALRARRVRAHIRVCEGCREAAAAQRGGRIGGWLPVPGILAALRGLFGGGAAVPVAGGAALVSLVTAGALVVPGPWSPSGPADASPAVATPAAAQGSRAPAATALAAPVSAGSTAPAPSGARSARTAVAGTAPTGTLVTPAAAGATAPGTASADPSAADPSAGDPSAAPASPVVRVRATGGASPASGVTVTAPGVSATVSGSGVSADVAGVGVSAGSGGVAVTSPAANVSVRPSTTGSVVPTVRADVPAVQVPRVSVPSTTVQPITTPSVTVPSTTVGPVTTPQVTVPSVSTPTVTTPEVTAPQQVSTPSLAGGLVPGVSVNLSGTPGITVGG